MAVALTAIAADLSPTNNFQAHLPRLFPFNYAFPSPLVA